jgi:hypothetical protein
MRKNEPKTPLLALLRSLTEAQRLQLAEDASTSVSYLYALGSCQRSACGATLAMQIEKATEKMCERTGGATAIVNMRDLATMCLVDVS